ncbi:MAG TPA: thioredoxin domain-containing protein [Acidobacteriaceae bacterium]|jgi:thiol-disulfide isomerase/thioredoxin|nr:thioredoxin domain-containing protein [Acidobacteriaceae bacterium]
MRGLKLATLSFLFLAFTTLSNAQFVGPRVPDDFHDKTMLHPPSGSKVAIIVFEDLGCPACAAAHPMELKAAAEYHVPIVRYDFPIVAHVWTFNGAVCARYLQDKVDPKLADQYRTDVFAAQRMIANKDDLTQFTRRWMQQHGHAMPFVLDPTGSLAAKVKADYDLGLRLNVTQTPTIVVVTQNNYQLVCGTQALQDPTRLFPILKAAVAQANETPKLQGKPTQTPKRSAVSRM